MLSAGDAGLRSQRSRERAQVRPEQFRENTGKVRLEGSSIAGYVLGFHTARDFSLWSQLVNQFYP